MITQKHSTWNIVGSLRKPGRLLATLGTVTAMALAASALPMEAFAQAPAKKPNIVIIWGDDIGQSNVSVYSRGMMGYQTPNIDRVAREGMQQVIVQSQLAGRNAPRDAIGHRRLARVPAGACPVRAYASSIRSRSGFASFASCLTRA